MTIIVTLDIMLAKRKMTSRKLAAAIGITEANLSMLKAGHARGVRFSTLNAICNHLNCKPGDILDYAEGPEEQDTISETSSTLEDEERARGR